MRVKQNYCLCKHFCPNVDTHVFLRMLQCEHIKYHEINNVEVISIKETCPHYLIYVLKSE